MARYAGGGKNTVEGCRSIDVLEWHRRGCLRTPRWFSWAWTRDGERVASINVETQRHSVSLKYRSRWYGEGWNDVSSGSPSRGRRAGSVANGLGLRVRSLQAECIAVAGSRSCTEPDGCLPAVTAIGLPTQASKNRRISGGLGNRKRSECSWAEAPTCLKTSRTSQRACTGGPTSVGVSSMT